MRRLPLLVVAASLALAAPLRAQGADPYAAAADRLIDAALRDTTGYHQLGVLVDRFGHRLSGSESLLSRAA